MSNLSIIIQEIHSGNMERQFPLFQVNGFNPISSGSITKLLILAHGFKTNARSPIELQYSISILVTPDVQTEERIELRVEKTCND